MNDPGINLLNNLPCSIFSFANDGIIKYTNEPLLQQLGYACEELSGQHVEKIFTLSSRIFYQTHFFPLLQLQHQMNEVFLTLQAKDNTSIPVLINANQIKDGSEIINICACITVPQRKKYEDEILQAKKIAEDALQKNELLQKAQSQLELSNQELDKQMTQLKHTNKELLQLNDIVAHDLQEPVRKIGFYVDLLKREWRNEVDKKTINSFAIVIKSTDRIRKVLQNLQEYIYILTKEIKKTAVDLNVVMFEQIAIIEAENPEIKFSVQAEKLPVIEADAAQLNLLFHELLKNSVEFRRLDENLLIQISGSVIEENFYSSLEGRYKYVEFAKITIEDNGIGFNPLYKELIFKILKRLDHKRPGLGFGLAICKRIAENHLGYITASGEEDKGAKFVIHLPVAH